MTSATISSPLPTLPIQIVTSFVLYTHLVIEYNKILNISILFYWIISTYTKNIRLKKFFNIKHLKYFLKHFYTVKVEGKFEVIYLQPL